MPLNVVAQVGLVEPDQAPDLEGRHLSPHPQLADVSWRRRQVLGSAGNAEQLLLAAIVEHQLE